MFDLEIIMCDNKLWAVIVASIPAVDLRNWLHRDKVNILNQIFIKSRLVSLRANTAILSVSIRKTLLFVNNFVPNCDLIFHANLLCIVRVIVPTFDYVKLIFLPFNW